MGNDNGSTKEQKLELKKKKFEENPDRFICVEDLIMAIEKLEDGKLAFITNLRFPRTDYLMAKAEVDFQLTKVLHMIDEKMAAKQRIVLAKTNLSRIDISKIQ